MTNSSKNEDNKINITVIVTTIVTVIGTIVGAYFLYATNVNVISIPINTTQTAEARLTMRAAGQVFTIPTISLPTDTPPTSTQLPAMWDVFSTDGASFAPLPFGDCSNIGVYELGIYASNCDLIFEKNAIKQRGVYGLSMPISHNVKIQLSVTITNLIEGEFWVGLSNRIDPQSSSLIYAMTPDPGGISVYLNKISSPNSRYSWTEMAPAGWKHGQSWLYNFTIQLNGNNVSMEVNGVSFVTMTASSTDRLFLGYRSKPNRIGTYLNASISGLTISNP